mmetsp:Transcript_58977/g.151643  ORF Transcript_58977/g.151643 Transcript_58977/m.151643 type:complete len:214 (-) Transcript_58977:679-1320(-)
MLLLESTLTSLGSLAAKPFSASGGAGSFCTSALRRGLAFMASTSSLRRGLAAADFTSSPRSAKRFSRPCGTVGMCSVSSTKPAQRSCWQCATKSHAAAWKRAKRGCAARRCSESCIHGGLSSAAAQGACRLAACTCSRRIFTKSDTAQSSSQTSSMTARMPPRYSRMYWDLFSFWKSLDGATRCSANGISLSEKSSSMPRACSRSLGSCRVRL